MITQNYTARESHLTGAWPSALACHGRRRARPSRRQLQRASHQRELQLPNPMSGGEGDLRTTKRRRTAAGTSSGARLASARSARGLPHLRLPIPMSGSEGNRPAHDEEEMDGGRFQLQRAAQL